MYETANKALESARELSLQADQFRQVGPRQSQAVLTAILGSFANTHDQGVASVWSHLKHEGASLQSENGIGDIGAMVAPDTPVWLLLEDWDSTKQRGNYWVFEGLYSAVIAVLSNMHLIEYYIVDRKLNWMVLENHHDVLIGIGDPAESFIRNLGSAQQTATRDRVKKRGA